MDVNVAQGRKRPLLSLILVLALIVGVGVAGALATNLFGGKDKPKAPTYPKAWDPRIAPLARIASHDRGLTFLHPVFVDFMSTKAFDIWVTHDDNNLTSAQKQSVSTEEGTLRAQGFISGGVSLLKEQNTLNGSGILGEYAYQDKRIRVRGTVLTPALKVTLVHELTHVLQDQHFDLEGKFKQLDKSPTEDSWAFDAIVEGDARRIEHQYLSSLPKAVRQQVIRAQDAESKTFGKQVQNVPDFLVADSQAPYDLGEVAVSRAARGGNAAVNKLFEVPPIHEIQLMQPWLLGQHWKDRAFTKPTLAKGDKSQGRSEWGAYYLYQVLAERLDVSRALAIADGWGGDEVLWYTHDKRACASFSLTGNSASATANIYSGLRTWVASMGGAAQVSMTRATVEMNTCDPGSKFRAGPPHASLAEELVTTRNAIEAEVEKEGAPQAVATCFAMTLAQRFSLATLQANTAPPSVTNEIRQIAATCSSR